jgi:hypothetical protein
MKILHVAAFALTGWYLMAPPPNALWKLDGTGPFLPLVQWMHMQSFDTAAQCEQGLLDEAKFYAAHSDPPDVNPWVFAQCIATDDPRLKRN